VLIHIGTVMTVALSHFKASKPAAKVVEIEYLEPTPAPPVAEQPADKNKKAQPAQVLNKQIVEQEKQINDEIDEKTRLLSKFNQKVIQQTKAEKAGKFKNTTQGGMPDEGSKTGQKDKKDLEKVEKVAKHEKGELPDLKALAPKFSLSPGPRAPSRENNGDPSQNDDYLKDVKPALQTMLSTREFVYYTYYSRIKEALRQHWEPSVREKVKIIYRQGRTIASANDRITQVMVTLNKNGDLLKVEVLTQSGVTDLDSAAVEAFKDAAPFPNPPKGMIESDGLIKIRWDFVLEA
jgi:protein TonB